MRKNPMSDEKQIKPIKTNREFFDFILFMKDDENINVIYPFRHEIDDKHYQQLLDGFFEDEDEVPAKEDFCLLFEPSFGWGWLHKDIVCHLQIAEESDYSQLKNAMISKGIIQEKHILNEV